MLFKSLKYWILLSIGLWAAVTSHAQSSNDECLSAEFLSDVADYCSGEMGFSNIGATLSSDIAPTCWSPDDEQADVWFSFRPRNRGLLIRLFGENPNGANTLDNSALAIYNGTCGDLSLLVCSDVDNGFQDALERVLTDVVVGATYYIRVSSAVATAGSFELCIREFTPVPVPESDCNSSVVLCDKSSFFVENLNSIGLNDRELPIDGCINQESASAWYTWTALTTGSLTFTLTPTSPNPEEDLDFILFRLPNGLTDCNTKEIVRCMASGETTGFDNRPCLGPTGLRTGATDIVETGGCQAGDDNFLAPLDMIAGESYALIVNNFTESGAGFTIDFGGTSDFLGPLPDFDIVARDGFECDKIITFSNLSTSATDMITEYRWNFGDGANPQGAVGPGPHQVVYETFGDKLAALTVVTERGCEVTDISDISINPCCIDNMLIVTGEITASTCNGGDEGAILLTAGSGSPMYLYSFEGGPLLANNIYGGLVAGTYDFSSRDIKGCTANGTIRIVDPPPVTLTLTSALDTVQLGEGTTLLGTAGPLDRTFTYQWSPVTGLSCTDCPDPSVIPPGTTTYTLTAIDQQGCDASADLTLFTIDIKNLFAPNAVSLNGVNVNNRRFKLHGNIAIASIELLEIYDRWGNVIYAEENFDLNDPNYLGWDGTVKGRTVNSGVYVWVAKVRFVDGEVKALAGDIMIFD